MKKILLLGGSAQQVVAIETAKRLGYQTVLCDYLTNNPGQYAADRFYLVSTTDMTTVLEIARKEKIDGVLAYASDPAAPTAAYVAEQMGLPGNPYASVNILCNKDLFRCFLEENGFHTPKNMVFGTLEQALKASAAFDWPVIVKPVDSSGSKGVTVLHSQEGLAQAVEFAISVSRQRRIVIEQFIEKKHPYLIGGDIFVVNGQVVLWGLMNCHRDPAVNPLVPVGKSYPLQLEEEDIFRVKVMLSALVAGLGFRNGAMNVELVVDRQNRVWPIDIGPRSGGNMIPDLLGDIFGIDVVELSVLAAMGEMIRCEPGQPQGCYVTYNLHSSRDGIYEGISFDEKIAPYIYRTCLYKKTGDEVSYFDNASKCLGIVFFHFEDTQTMTRVLNGLPAGICIRLKDAHLTLQQEGNGAT